MASTTTPTWTDTAAALISPVCLARGGAIIRTTLDLRTKYAARLNIGIGRGGTTAIATTGVYVIIRQIPGNGTIRCIAPYAQFMTGTAAAILKLINNLAGYAIGTTAMTIDGTGTPALDDWYCFWGETAIPAGTTALPRLEFVRITAQAGPGTSIVVDAPILNAVVDNMIMTSKADYWTCDLQGGSVYEILVDYYSHTAGESVAVGAWYSTMDSVTGVFG